MRLDGKVAIISGGAHGMGAEEARLFTSEGASVVISDVLEKEGQQVEAELVSSGGNATFVHADVTSEGDWERTVRAAVSRYGKLDILVNNAGIGSGAYPDPLDVEGWRRIMDVNATGAFLGMKYAIPEMMKASGGAIVNISSIAGFVGNPDDHPAYNASKGALRIMTKVAAARYGPQGIRANSVHPGFISPMLSGGVGDPEEWEERRRRIPLGRRGKEREVANGVLFLASDEASYVTGTELVIDGGFLAG